MRMLFTRLPVELLTMVFGHLPLRNLTSISLVCRAWRIVAFSYLYHTMRLSNVSHLKVLEERLLAGDAPDSLSVPIHLKCLKLGGIGGRIEAMDAHYFETIIPKLTRLNCVHWELAFMPDDFSWLLACTELKSVHLQPLSNIFTYDEWMERLPQLIQFTNLTHFSLNSCDLPHGFNESYSRYTEPFTSLLRSSPNLESFILSIEGEGEPYFPTPILESLDNQFIFPRLHTFHILGDVDPDWIGFISKRTHPLRAFLARHPTIQDLKIGCPMDDVSRDGMAPDELSCLLPSVTHLACPLFLCEAVVTSKLAGQLKSLDISNPHLGDLDDRPFDPIVQKMAGNALPNLRRLSIWDEVCYYLLEVKVLQAFFLAAKGLEELEFKIGVDDYDGFLFVLGQAKNLRRIRIAYDQFRGSEGSWKSFVIRLAGRCPRLETIADCYGADTKIVRDDLGRPSIGQT